MEIYKSLKYNLTKLKKNKSSKIFITGFAFKGVPKPLILNSTTLSLLSKFKKDKFRNIWGHDFKIEKNQIKKLGIKPCDLKSGLINQMLF